jgi:hypothetical protein
LYIVKGCFLLGGVLVALVAVVRDTEPTMFRALKDRWEQRLKAKADAENGEWTVACRRFDQVTANPHGGARTKEQDGAGPTSSTRTENGSTDAVAAVAHMPY